jgi:hypothetical protein
MNPFKRKAVPPPPKDKFRWAHIFYRVSMANEHDDQVS